MKVTVLFGESPEVSVQAREDGDQLMLGAAELERATGWTLKPEGLCRKEACVPLPPDGSWQDDEGRVDLTAFARRAGRPVVHDSAHAVWGFGEPAQSMADVLTSGRAPDFTLPDLDGRSHRLSDYRGRKVFLLAWGSY